MKKKVGILIVLVIIYFLLKYYIPNGNYLIYPINLFVTFLHEFGHSFFAIITGGTVKELEINKDGSGLATTSGGIKFLVLMGGYIGSAIFGNILLYIGLKKKKISQNVLYFLSGLMIFTSIFWFSNLMTLIILIILSGLIWLVANKTNFDQLVLQFLGITSILYIIEDFNVGPSSDLAKFTEIFLIVPQIFWMYIWLLIVIIITGFNLRLIFKK